MPDSITIGIDSIAFAVPHRYVELSELARARGVDPAKFTTGLGCRRMAVTDPGEDTVALAATAAHRLIAQTGIDRARIGLLIVGTETGVDHSKPVASHVQGLLGLPRTMRVFDTTHACYGGTAGLMTACEWIASGVARGRVAIVICSDVARYGVGTPGEPTQGAGAIAMLVTEAPRVVAIDVGASGVSSADVYDFWRPHGRREAVVDGHYSIECYLEALAEAYRGWCGHARERGWTAATSAEGAAHGLARIVYHVPFPRMAHKAHAHLVRIERDEATGDPTQPIDPSVVAGRYEQQVAPSLRVCAEIGNSYTGSLYFGLLGLLESEAHALANLRIGMFSYGSGCVSEFFSGVVQRHAARAIAVTRTTEILGARTPIGIDEYERLLALPADAPLAIAPAPGGYRLAAIRDHRRIYVAG
ncbi:MAG: hydroxymethylglutaryl-CoA synthase family protein [Kofleriaceae bacterium]